MLSSFPIITRYAKILLLYFFHRSDMSCVVVDNLESLIDYGPIGPRYSNLTLQTLLVLLKKQPPKGKRLLIICTTSRKDVLNQMEMLSAFTDVLHVSNLGKAEHIERVIETDPGFSPQERQTIRSNYLYSILSNSISTQRVF